VHPSPVAQVFVPLVNDVVLIANLFHPKNHDKAITDCNGRMLGDEMPHLVGQHISQFIFILSQSNQFSAHVDTPADCTEGIRRGKFTSATWNFGRLDGRTWAKWWTTACNLAVTTGSVSIMRS